jgi:hypothetical protein
MLWGAGRRVLVQALLDNVVVDLLPPLRPAGQFTQRMTVLFQMPVNCLAVSSRFMARMSRRHAN